MANSRPWALTTYFIISQCSALSPESHEVVETRHLENEAVVGSSTACIQPRSRHQAQLGLSRRHECSAHARHYRTVENCLILKISIRH